ncbi:MAG: response regulator [Elusimicrobiales bacterium]|nr:response regulator [Elusimicrobiales bacterium]
MTDPISSKKPPAILMVDDTPANLELLSGMLKGRGYKVRAAVSGKMALQAARNDPPDLILLDINMPEMNGYEVCTELKADEKLKDIPVIFLSALTETIDKVKAFGTGGVDYITKPFQFEEVEARVETHLEMRRQKNRLQENYNELGELKKMRDNLVNLLLHDLRPPLASICGQLELIKEKEKTAISADSAGRLAETVKTAKHLIHMVGTVLDKGKLEEVVPADGSTQSEDTGRPPAEHY